MTKSTTRVRIAARRHSWLAVCVFLSSGADTTAQTEPGAAFRDCPQCPEMVVIPAGAFTMGSPETEANRDRDEGPQRQITIKEQFALGKYEVTRAEFAAFVRETGHRQSGGCYTWKETAIRFDIDPRASWTSPGFSQTDRHPVACVSWEDASAYARWLVRKTGKGYRLPSEAEWEYAARAGTTTRFFWGEEERDACRYANGADAAFKLRNPEVPVTDCSDTHAYTAPVGGWIPNRFGLYDTSGNLAEWVEDCWNEDYVDAPNNGAARSGGDCSRRVARGGSWFHDFKVTRSAVRLKYPTGLRGSSLGFRVARSP